MDTIQDPPSDTVTIAMPEAIPGEQGSTISPTEGSGTVSIQGTILEQPQTIDSNYTYAEIELGKFDREKLIEEYIYKNIHELWQNIFNEKITSIERQKAEFIGIIDLPNGKHMPRRGVRLDLYLTCENGNKYIVEIKNPKSGQYDTIGAIGKVLFYSVKFPEANRLVILSTVYDEGFLETIQKYNLPIDFVLFTHDKAYLLKKNG